MEWLCTHRDDIDHEPVYQRKGHIWSPADKALLIDSILNDYDIPKMYVADFTSSKSNSLNKKRRRYAVIDGKQRLEAVMEFFDGKLKLKSDFTYVQRPSWELGGATAKDLATRYPALLRKFYDYELAVMGVVTDEEGKINDLFIRLNRSKPLVGAEVRNAMLGQVPPMIREVAEHPFFRTRIGFETTRMQERNAAAKLLLVEFRGKFVDTKKSQLDGFVDDGIRSQLRNFDTTVQRCRRVLNDMAHVFKERDPLLKSQGPLTVYYWFVKEHRQHRARIRDFLLQFDTLRQINRQRASEQPPPSNLDSELLSYDFLNRSPNDQASCIRRYAILEARFESYLSTATVSAQASLAPRALLTLQGK